MFGLIILLSSMVSWSVQLVSFNILFIYHKFSLTQCDFRGIPLLIVCVRSEEIFTEIYVILLSEKTYHFELNHS